MSDMTEINKEIVAEELENKNLTFYIENDLFGIELQEVIEIISVQHITEVPNTPDFIKGIINLRGKIVPVLDVRGKLGRAFRAFDEQTCIIVVNYEEAQIGLIVDRVNEVVNSTAADTLQVPEVTEGAQRFLKSVSDIHNMLILNLDLHAFFTEQS